MKGKKLSIQEVAALTNGTRVYVEDRISLELTVELVAKTPNSPVVRTVSIEAGEDNYRKLSDMKCYYEYVQGINLQEVPEITFDTIRSAVAHCRYLNASNEKTHRVQLFPGIEEAYEILNRIAIRNSQPNRGLDTLCEVVTDEDGDIIELTSPYEQGYEIVEDGEELC